MICNRCGKDRTLRLKGNYIGLCFNCADYEARNKPKKEIIVKEKTKKRLLRFCGEFPGYSEKIVQVIKPRTFEQLLNDAKKFRGYK